MLLFSSSQVILCGEPRPSFSSPSPRTDLSRPPQAVRRFPSEGFGAGEIWEDDCPSSLRCAVPPDLREPFSGHASED